MAGETETGILSGAASGATTGAIAGGVPGAVVGGLIGASLGFLASDSARKKQRKALKQAEAAAEKVRAENILKQMGAKQQADSLTLQATSTTSSGTPAAPKSNPTPGTIGAGMNSSGTF